MATAYDRADPKADHGPELAPTEYQDGKIVYYGIDEKHPYVTESAYARGPLSRNPFGLAPWLFGLIVALVTAVIVGAAVGGGVGAAMKSKQSDSSLSNSTTKSSSVNLSNYLVAKPESVTALNWTCPGNNNSTYRTAFGQTFTIHCGIDWVAENSAVIDSTGAQLYNIQSNVAYDLKHCLESCSSYNSGIYFHNKNATSCKAVSFSRKLSTHAGGNCALKNAKIKAGGKGVADTASVSAECTGNCPT